MKIGLIHPKGITLREERLEKIIQTTDNVKNFWDNYIDAAGSSLAVIASLTPSDNEVKIIDDAFETIDFDEKFDVVGISTMTPQSARAFEIADTFRKKGVTVVIGGIHATVMPKETKEHCDSVFVGEAEDTWPLFIDDFKNGKISEIYKATKPVDLTKLPIPRYDLLKRKSYALIWIQTSRGCPHDCEFCGSSRVYGFRFRHKSIEQIVNEVSLVHKLWPNARKCFGDDNFFVDRTFSKKLLTHLERLNFRWFAQTDISIAKDEMLLNAARKAGCTTLFVGFETVSKKSLASINRNSWKSKYLETYPEVVRKIQSKGIGVAAGFIIGFDNDTKETADDIINFIIDNNVFITQMAILTPVPGTRLYERLQKEGRLLNIPWRYNPGSEVRFIPKNMTVEELEAAFRKIYKKIFSREIRIKVLNHFKDIYKNLI